MWWLTIIYEVSIKNLQSHSSESVLNGVVDLDCDSSWWRRAAYWVTVTLTGLWLSKHNFVVAYLTIAMLLNFFKPWWNLIVLVLLFYCYNIFIIAYLYILTFLFTCHNCIQSTIKSFFSDSTVGLQMCIIHFRVWGIIDIEWDELKTVPVLQHLNCFCLQGCCEFQCDRNSPFHSIVCLI